MTNLRNPAPPIDIETVLAQCQNREHVVGVIGRGYALWPVCGEHLHGAARSARDEGRLQDPYFPVIPSTR